MSGERATPTGKGSVSVVTCKARVVGWAGLSLLGLLGCLKELLPRSDYVEINS